MEYSELEKLWKTYDSKLNRLEKLNKKLILETLSKKPQKKLNWQKYRNYYGLIVGPVVLTVALHPMFKPTSLSDAKFLAGAMLLLLTIAFSTWFSVTAINKLKKVDLINDTVLESATRINEYKEMYVSRSNWIYITFPTTLAGVLLIGWDSLHFDKNLFLFIAALSLISVFLGKTQLQRFKKRMDKLVCDIDELKEYKE